MNVSSIGYSSEGIDSILTQLSRQILVYTRFDIDTESYRMFFRISRQLLSYCTVRST